MTQSEGVEVGKQDNGVRNHGLAQLSFRPDLPPNTQAHTSVLRNPGWRTAREQQPEFTVGGRTHTSHPPTTAPGVQTSATFASTSTPPTTASTLIS